jgi:hypothetical protein
VTSLFPSASSRITRLAALVSPQNSGADERRCNSAISFSLLAMSKTLQGERDPLPQVV